MFLHQDHGDLNASRIHKRMVEWQPDRCEHLERVKSLIMRRTGEAHRNDEISGIGRHAAVDKRDRAAPRDAWGWARRAFANGA